MGRIKFTGFSFLLGFLVVSGLFISMDVSLVLAASGPESKAPLPDLRIVPDQFLRSWDPVTVFFPSDQVEAEGPEDDPGRHVSLSPSHAGGWRWLDRRTLLFRPADPWPPLTTFTLTSGKITRKLSTLMEPPVETSPRDGEKGLDPVENISLEFSSPMAPGALHRMTSIELTNITAAEKSEPRRLPKDAFSVKVPERKSSDAKSRYILVLKEPIPMGMRATVRLGLSLDHGNRDSFFKFDFSTAEPFRITRFGSGNRLFPVANEGADFSANQAIKGSSHNRHVKVRFSAKPDRLGPVESRNLVRFDPSVENLKFSVTGNDLTISGDFLSETLYKVTLSPTHLADKKGRKLLMEGENSLYLIFPSRDNFINWGTSNGIVERYGPKMLPLTGRGLTRMDMKIHAVDPLDRSFWPFPDHPVITDDSSRPPSPGEEPEPFRSTGTRIPPQELAKRIKALGSPLVSTIVDIPLKKNGKAMGFGLDLSPYLEKGSGKDLPGTFLVGMRKLDKPKERRWVRLTVTDLSLSTVEERENVRFFVTSLSTGLPVRGAQVTIQGMTRKSKKKSWKTFASDITDMNGTFLYPAPGRANKNIWKYVGRIIVQKGRDILVLDPSRPSDLYFNNHWSESYENWLQWAFEDLSYKREKEQILCHLFTERPVYKPEAPVHIKGYVRTKKAGRFELAKGAGTLVVSGPGGLEWRYPVKLTPHGSFYKLFDEKKLPTGEFSAYLEYKKNRYGHVAFKKEAYRLPKFEVQLHTPEKAAMDKPFDVRLIAEYYAGGKAAKRPVRWRITRFPHTFTPEKIEGYFFSTDARFSGKKKFPATSMRVTEGITGENGAAEISIDPGLEPFSSPMRYVVEATVTGSDDDTVTTTSEIFALPPFVLGLKVPRHVRDQKEIRPEIIAVGPGGKMIPGLSINVRLLKREWHSYLSAGDFSSSAAKYTTDVVDSKIYETSVESSGSASLTPLTLEGAGVYIVEIEARDRLGRSQLVRVDLFNGGKEAVTWSRPPSKIFKATPGKKSYAPGETASIILESPFQDARVLAVIEEPDGLSTYRWLDVKKGSATFDFPIREAYMPRVPVHFLLMRGRKETPSVSDTTDLFKPATLAATKWVEVDPVNNRLQMKLDHPKKSMPGKEIPVTINLKDGAGNPVSGEATLWLVDQSVLALGREQRLDPLPDFITSPDAWISFHDTRNMTLGVIPLTEQPGGDVGGMEASDLMDRVTVRKNFQPVPYYNPAIRIDGSGTATVRVKLPDNLTNFKIRAKAVAGSSRFGFAGGHLSVRLPVIVQPSLPRFVRPGDRFTLTAMGRIVEGAGGSGRSVLKTEGVVAHEPESKSFQWEERQPVRIEYDVSVPSPSYTKEGVAERNSVRITLGAERMDDGAMDAFEVDLPIFSDRKPVRERAIHTLTPDSPLHLEEITEPFRTGTMLRSIKASFEPALIPMAAGLDYLLAYPHGCTEQRISRARGWIAAEKFGNLLYRTESAEEQEHAVMETIKWIDSSVGPDNLVAYWPGARGYVSLTAWSLQFLFEAKDMGYQVDDTLLDTLILSLKNALRSDYNLFITGESYAERCWALTALAEAGELDSGYAAELATKSSYLSPESMALVTRALYSSAFGGEKMVEGIVERLKSTITTRSFQGKEIYGGLMDTAGTPGNLILPSETRAIGEILRTLVMVVPEERKLANLLADTLITLGKEDGWGSTNSNSSALLALTDYFSFEETGPMGKAPKGTLRLITEGGVTTFQDIRGKDLFHTTSTDREAITLSLAGPSGVFSLSSTDREVIAPPVAEPGGKSSPPSTDHDVTAPPVAEPGGNSSPSGKQEDAPDQPGSSRSISAPPIKTKEMRKAEKLVVQTATSYMPTEPGSFVKASSRGFVVNRELLLVRGEDRPMERIPLDTPGSKVRFSVGDIIEEHIEVVNPEDRHFAAVVIPLAAGMEPLNPSLATAPPEATPSKRTTLAPSHVSHMDHRMAFYYDTLPKGTYHFYFRNRAVTQGRFIQPAPFAEMMYDQAISGNGNGAVIIIDKKNVNDLNDPAQ